MAAGDPALVVPYSFAPQDALAFLPRTVEQSVALVPATQRRRALDIGCAVGRATFELSKHFDEVSGQEQGEGAVELQCVVKVALMMALSPSQMSRRQAIGIDFSHHFAATATKMKELGELEYEAHIQGDIREVRTARLPADAMPERAAFQQGDACNLPPSLGKFDVVFASNLLCRLPEPAKFLSEIERFVATDGILALVSPYSWLEEYTAKDKWIGATVDAQGAPVDSFSVIETHLSEHFELVKRQDYPFMIREHARKFQYGVSDGTFWKRK